MPRPTVHLPTIALLTLVALVAASVALVSGSRSAFAFPPAGQDYFGLRGQVSLVSRLGQETLELTGTATLERSDPYDDAGVQVIDIELVSMLLSGESVTGPVVVTESATLASIGEVRSQQPGQDFPADSFIDVFVVVAIPASPTPTVSVHNDVAARIVPMFGGTQMPLTSWPPFASTYAASYDPCVPLLPADPKEICVTALSFRFESPGGVGGVSELAGEIGAPLAEPAANGGGLSLLIVAAWVAAGFAAACALGGAWYVRRALR
ncbi:MAG: hypothetical protein IH866_05810 [Chloroflexi bacterium]|nr:hypothetical protein [Chloroflexota bacterium]